MTRITVGSFYILKMIKDKRKEDRAQVNFIIKYLVPMMPELFITADDCIITDIPPKESEKETRESLNAWGKSKTDI